MLIADEAYSAEDVIELHVVIEIHKKYKVERGEESKCAIKWYKKSSFYCFLNSFDFSRKLHKVIKRLDFVKKEAMRMKNIKEMPDMLSVDVGSVSHPVIDNHTTVALDDDKLNELMDKLTRQNPSLYIISITGMCGIGKTTLGKIIYDHQYIVKYFDVRWWVTISQEYHIGKLILDMLDRIGVFTDQSEREKLDYHHLGEKLHKHLIGRRYLVIIDDIWSIEAWDRIKMFLPDTKGSGIVVTTRISTMARALSFNICEMNLLDDNNSWSLLSKMVFGQEKCPIELEEIGRKIAKN